MQTSFGSSNEKLQEEAAGVAALVAALELGQLGLQQQQQQQQSRQVHEASVGWMRLRAAPRHSLTAINRREREGSSNIGNGG